MINEKILRQKAQSSIHIAIKDLVGETYVEQSKEPILYGEYPKINRLQLVQGVRALLLECHIEHGSSCDVDLYTLLSAYLWDEEARTEMNAIVKRHGA
ncbi:hypothetical protein ACFQPC_16310 [Herminiimonas glaciei]|uniref:Uncharacterized protein n=1 Tax=Herminiimonas glaciei TaxID=523788 RepID=A0ABW2IF45_9BURK